MYSFKRRKKSKIKLSKNIDFLSFGEWNNETKKKKEEIGKVNEELEMWNSYSKHTTKTS